MAAHYPYPDNPEEWKALTIKGGELCEENPFLCALIIAIMDELDRNYKHDMEEAKCG